MYRDQDYADPPPALTAFELTYSPGYRPTGSPIDPNASRQALQERRITIVQALSAQLATDRFERSHGRMVTNCARVQFDGEVQS